MAKNTKRSVATWVSAAMAVSGLLLGAGLIQMLAYMSQWTAKEAGSIYDLILTGLVALSFMVFVSRWGRSANISICPASPIQSLGRYAGTIRTRSTKIELSGI
ncbi:MAG: hypothetical protein NTV27_02320 [Chloroflexi bacterium]|nr:hypothetical protein [Chloroflexota bacterium]